MIATPHLVAGAAVGASASRLKIKNFYVLSFAVFILGLLSHLLLDIVPHSEYKEMWRSWSSVYLACEIVIAFALIYHFGWAWTRNAKTRRLILIGCFAGALPDAFYVAVNMMGINWPWLASLAELNSYFHGRHVPVIIGGPIQAVIVFLSLIFLHNNSNSRNPA